MNALLTLSWALAAFQAAPTLPRIPESPPALTAPPSGAIKVVVSPVNAAQVVSGVTVTLTDSNGPFQGAAATAVGGILRIQTAITDNTGRAEFSNLLLGEYQIRAVIRAVGNNQSRTISATTTLGALQPVVTVMLTASPDATISGRITDSNGQPVANLRVTTGVLAYRDGRRTVLSRNMSMTDAQGQYRLPAVLPGDYFVVAIPLASNAISTPTYFPGVADPDAATSVSIREGQEVVGLDFPVAAPQVFRVSGTVVMAPPGPLPNGQTRIAA
jgi:hypothetical protein